MDEEERNYCCLILLLSRVGLVNLRKLFINEWDTFGGFDPWTDCHQNGTDLLTKFNPLPYETAKVQSGDTATWDVSLFVKVLLNSRPPFVHNIALVDGLKCLKETRNSLSHTASGKIKSADFAPLYNDACNALLLLGASTDDFKKVEEDVNQPLNEVLSLLKKWTTQDKDIMRGIAGTSITINGVVKALTAGGAMVAWAAGSAYFLHRYKDDPDTVIRLVQGAIVPSSLATGAMIYVIGILPGSFKIVVGVDSLQALDLLWKRYEEGQLNKDLENVIVTDHLKQLANAEEILEMLHVSVTISEDEYLRARDKLIINIEDSPKSNENMEIPIKRAETAEFSQMRIGKDRAEEESDLEDSTFSSRIQYGTGPSKVILIGRSGVGKSTLFLRIKDGKFHDNIQGETLDFLDKKITVSDNKSVGMRLFDTAGMEKWHEKIMTRSYYRESRVALIMYSADDMDSVDDLKDYIEDVNRHAPGAKKFLVRNKIDLEDQAVREEEVEIMLNKKGYSFEKSLKHKISAKNGEGIEELLKKIGIVILKQAKSSTPFATHEIGTPLRRDKYPFRETAKSDSTCC